MKTQGLFRRKQILTVFELYGIEVFRERFSQLRSESPVPLLKKGVCELL